MAMDFKYCPKCGAQLHAGSRFCDRCGCNLERRAAGQQAPGAAPGMGSGMTFGRASDSQAPGMPPGMTPGAAPGMTAPKKKFPVAGIIGIVAVAVVAVALIVWGTTFRTLEVDLTSNITKDAITYVGADGSARANLDQTEARKAAATDNSRVQKFIDTVSFDLENESNLSNGDIVTVIARYDDADLKKYHLQIKNGTASREFTVTGLESDAPQDVNITGYNGQGYSGTTENELYRQTDDNTVYSYGSSRLTDGDVAGWNLAQTQRAINDICAWNGRKFDTPAIREYYEQFDWYYPAIDSDRFDGNEQLYMTSTEYENYRTLARHRDTLTD